MRRRNVLALAASSAVSLSSVTRAQRRVPVIGILGSGYPEDPTIALNLAMFARGLRQEGFVDGQNVRVEYRWARNQPDRLPWLAAELVALPVDVIVNEGGTPTALALKKATGTIPIVFHASNAVADGVVDNLAQPGGNLTGSSQFSTETVVKGFQFLTELAPNAPRIGMVSAGQASAVAQRNMQEIQASPAARKVAVSLLPAQSDSELEAAYAALAAERAAVLVFAISTYAEQLVALAARHRVPAVYNQRAFAAVGGLLSYGASIPAAYVLKGIYAGKILKGARPRDLPVQQAAKFELVLNLKTAAALGLPVPQSILIGADEVIE
jgi:putative tryptophan/tyrosine transport system substrate-binding protein